MSEQTKHKIGATILALFVTAGTILIEYFGF
jgi:hypothetical protein